MSRFTCSERDGAALFILSDAMGADDFQDLLAALRRRLDGDHPSAVILDFEEVVDLPSSAFQILGQAARLGRRAGVSIHVVHLSEKTRASIQRVQLDRHIPIAGTITEVLRRRR